MRLYFKVTNLDGNRLVKKIHESSKSKQRSWNSRVLKFIEQIELSSLINAQNMTIRQKVNIAKDKLNTTDAENWLRDVHNDRNCENGNKLRTFRQFKSYLQASSYVKSVKLETTVKLYPTFVVAPYHSPLKQDVTPSQLHL